MKVTKEMVDDMRISMVLVITIQPIIALVGMLMMLLVSNVVIQVGVMTACVLYSAMAMLIINTRWRVFMARVMVLN